MPEPITIITLVTTISTLLINLFQSFTEGHFKSNCCDCITIEHDEIEHK